MAGGGIGLSEAATAGGTFAGVGLLGLTLIKLLGNAFSWLLTRADRKEEVLAAKLEKRVEELEARDEQRARENVALRLAFEIVAGVVRRTDPANADLARAERILNAAFVVGLDTPGDMQALLDKLNGVER